MTTDPITRRDASRILLGAALLGGVSVSPGAAIAQPRRGQEPPLPALLRLLEYTRSHNWTLRSTVNVQAYQRLRQDDLPLIEPLDFKTAAAIFPTPEESATHVCAHTDELSGTLKFDGRLADDQLKFQGGYHSGARYARLEAINLTARNMEFQVELRMTCWQTEFNEQAARQVPWPSEWPEIPASTFRPVQPLDFVDYRSDEVQSVVRSWTDGQDPRSIPPVTLAKFFAGRVQETLQPSGSGLAFHRTGAVEGIELKGAAQTLRDGRGSPHDIATALAAVYLAAGLPARTVIGVDVRRQKGRDGGFLSRGGRPELRSWVEFCLFDEDENAELWVPVDVARLRALSSRADSLDRPWRYFGTHNETDGVLPIAFHFHPPTSVVAHGSPAFWGWFTTPEYQLADQRIRFEAMTTPRRREDMRREPPKPQRPKEG